MDGAWRLRVYGAMVLGAGCDFESWMTVVKRCELCMGYVGMFSPKDGKSHTYHASVYSFRVVHDPLWIKICYVMKTQSGSPLLYIDDAAVSSPISMEHVQNACWLCAPKIWQHDRFPNLWCVVFLFCGLCMFPPYGCVMAASIPTPHGCPLLSFFSKLLQS